MLSSGNNTTDQKTELPLLVLTLTKRASKSRELCMFLMLYSQSNLIEVSLVHLVPHFG
uniref:Uncharacterized protein n=1 Tax=Anguilla anguilla TaxID=7936 RepID=A0A0E9W9H1_ANGAN